MEHPERMTLYHCAVCEVLRIAVFTVVVGSITQKKIKNIVEQRRVVSN